MFSEITNLPGFRKQGYCRYREQAIFPSKSFSSLQLGILPPNTSKVDEADNVAGKSHCCEIMVQNVEYPRPTMTTTTTNPFPTTYRDNGVDIDISENRNSITSTSDEENMRQAMPRWNRARKRKRWTDVTGLDVLRSRWLSRDDASRRATKRRRIKWIGIVFGVIAFLGVVAAVYVDVHEIQCSVINQANDKAQDLHIARCSPDPSTRSPTGQQRSPAHRRHLERTRLKRRLPIRMEG